MPDLDPTCSDVQTRSLQRAIDHVTASETCDTLVLMPGHYRIGDIQLRSGVNLHLTSGAVLQASDSAADIGDPTIPGHHAKRACLIEAKDAEAISITGHGHIDGNRGVLDNERYFKGMVRLTNCNQVQINGPIFSDACGWNTTPRHCRHVSIERLKIFNNRPLISCINTDGCNPDGCQDVRIDHCLMHTGDDAVAVKSTNYGGDAQDCHDIAVTDLLAINNSATAKVGTETMAARMYNISFTDVCAVNTCRLVGLDAFDYAQIENVSWTNCYVHHLDQSWEEAPLIGLNAPPVGKAFRSLPAQATARNLRLKNITAAEPAVAKVRTRLQDGQPAISDIEAVNIQTAGNVMSLTTEVMEAETAPTT